MNLFQRRCVMALVCLLGAGSAAPAQEPAGQQMESLLNQERTPGRGALYFLTPDDQLAIRVNVWGFVLKPGQYVVPKNTNLISMISYAGGPLQDAKLKSVRIVRDNSVRLAALAMTSPGLDGEDRKDKQDVLVVNVKKFISDGDESKIPQLMPGDTIVVAGSKFQSLSRFLDFAAKILVITQIYFYLQVANN
jgi:hypothetical protein